VATTLEESIIVSNPAPLPATPVLETARLVLRPLRLEDAPASQRLFPHWEIVRWLGAVVPWPYPANGAETHIRKCLEQRARDERFFWAICLKGALDELVGGIDLWPDNGTRDQRGFWLASEFQGRGLMTEAAERVTEYAFLELGWPYLWLSNAEANIASHRVKERQGARLVDKVQKHYVSGESTGEVWLLNSEDWKRRTMRQREVAS
jgi:[ribosomal protein S5]-alanine N-acetyltransferase